MKNFILIIAALTLPTIAGYAAILLMDKNRVLTGMERLPLSFGIGSGLLSVYMFAIGMTGLKYALPTLLPFFIIAAVILFVKRKDLFHRASLHGLEGTPPLSRPQFAICVLLVLLILWKLYFAAHSAISYPTYFDDAASTWDYKAKVIYYDKGLKGDNSNEVFGGTGGGYPLSTPLFRAWICMVAGEWNDAYAHTHSVAMFASLLLMFFAFTVRHASLFIAVVFTYALASVPLLGIHAFANYAEMPMAFYLTASAVSLSRWFLDNDKAYLYTACLSALAMIFTKNEGALVFAPTLAVIFLGMVYLSKSDRAAKKKLLLYSTVVAALLLLPWLALKLHYGEGLGTSGIIPEFHPEAFKELLSVLFREGSFGVACGAIIFLLTLNPKGLRNSVFLSYAAPAMLIFLAVLFVFIFTNNYEWLRLRTTINRTLLIAAPPLLMAAALFTEQLLSERALSK